MNNPLPPLIAANVQTTVFVFTEKGKMTKLLHPKDDKPPEIISRSLAVCSIALWRSAKLQSRPIGTTAEWDESTHKMTMERISKTGWKVDFHTKKVETVLVDEDPC
jgi:hypothetical protein